LARAADRRFVTGREGSVGLRSNIVPCSTAQTYRSMDITSLIVEAVSGAVGGNVAGAAMKDKSLGTIGNSIAGIVGGGLGGTILQSVMGSAAAGGGGMDMQSILANVGGGGVGGAILMIIVGIIKAQMSKQ